MLLGITLALLAGIFWGLVFVAPALLPDYPPAALAFGRYLAFGVIALALALPDRAALKQLTRADWIEALKLSLVGNIIYYLFLAASIQASGVPLASVLIGTLPVVIGICSNWLDQRRSQSGHIPWARLAPGLLLMAGGIGLVNVDELRRVMAVQGDVARYLFGAVLAIGAVAAWTWYPIRNSRWLAAHGHIQSRAWATAQGLTTLPLAALGWLGLTFWALAQPGSFALPLGPRPLAFVLLMLAIGLFASWLGTLAWNRASQLLPMTLVGQLIVFETLAALAYGFLHRGQWPGPASAAGIALLVAGVVLGVRVFSEEKK
jgi:drug/metabolite transporter (DMT)-like permease